MDSHKKTISDAKQGFEQSFAEGAFYNRQTQDNDHLQRILSFLPIKDGMRILDLGTGSGYLAFPIAKQHPAVTVTGLDIVEKALEHNRAAAEKAHLQNLRFVSYGGTAFPFADGCFDMVISRYALHHFPDIQKSFGEVSRVLSPDGFFFLSDPAPNENDTERFIDRYMQMKPDGHIRFYTRTEWIQIAESAGLSFSDSFDSAIRFPRKKTQSHGFEALLAQYDKAVIAGYRLEMTADEIYLTEQVNNILFTKQPKGATT